VKENPKGKLVSLHMSLKVEQCTDPAAWDAYVGTFASASAYHQWAWKQVIEATYGHPTYYLTASADGKTQGLLPLVCMRSWMFGHFLVSLPFFNYGGLLASTVESQRELLGGAVTLAKELGVRHVELRQGAASNMDWQDVSAKVAMIVVLPKAIDDYWSKLSSRLRNKVRHARKHGFQVRWGGSELVSSFYLVFATNMRNLGTPVYPRSWFENVCRLMPNRCRILTLWENEKPVAATILTTFGDKVELPWIASLPDVRKSYATVLLYWTALEWAAQNGYSEVDLGRCTPGGGTYQFKRQWNCEERPLHWYYWLAPGASPPNLRPDNPKYKTAIWIWQHLPLSVANLLGPRIVRSIP
jgi:serine/alanine adding enzyme